MNDTIIRFGIYRRVEHAICLTSFVTLVLTGLAQRFYSAHWAEWLIVNGGGIDVIRLIHRATGVIFTVSVAVHIAAACYGVIFKHWQPSMVVNKKDFTDAIANLKFYLGLSNDHAKCDRYDYKQKFEYWGVLLGGILMITTGFILWFPTQFFTLFPFLPGQIIPAAKLTHSNEAMLAFLIIVTWHIYGAVFSPEVFPLDTSIFTGKISKKRMEHEHPLELEKLSHSTDSCKKD